MAKSEEIIQKLEKKLAKFETNPKIENVGTVEKVTDNVIVASGLSKVKMGEEVTFTDGTIGLVLNLDEDSVGIILLGKGSEIKEGDSVKTTGRILSINASDDLLGRVINAV